VVYRQTATDNGQSIALTLRPLRGPLHPCWKLQNYGASFLVWKTVETYGNIGKKLETMGKNMKTWETGWVSSVTLSHFDSFWVSVPWCSRYLQMFTPRHVMTLRGGGGMGTGTMCGTWTFLGGAPSCVNWVTSFHHMVITMELIWMNMNEIEWIIFIGILWDHVNIFEDMYLGWLQFEHLCTMSSSVKLPACHRRLETRLWSHQLCLNLFNLSQPVSTMFVS